MLDRLPRELKLDLLDLSQDTYLRFISKEFFRLQNSLSKLKVSNFLDLNQLDLELIKRYQQTLSFWNGHLSHLLHPDISWDMLYAFVKNRRLYFQNKTCMIQKFGATINPPEPSVSKPDYEITDGTLKLHNIQAFYYHETIVLPKGTYNFLVAIVNHKLSRGLGTTTFQIGDKLKSYPSSFVNELIPEGEFAVLNLSTFQILDESARVDISIEEIGIYPKMGIELCYLQFSPYKEFEQIEEDYMFYSVPQYDFNPIEKSVYMNLQGIETKQMKEIDLNWYKQYYKNKERRVKMMYPMDQKSFKERKMRGCLAKWKVPF